MIRFMLISAVLFATPAYAGVCPNLPEAPPSIGDFQDQASMDAYCAFWDARIKATEAASKPDDWLCIRPLTVSTMALVGADGDGVVIAVTDAQRKYFEGRYQRCPDPK